MTETAMHPDRSVLPPEGVPTDPPTRPTRWERVGLAALLVGTAVAYLWNITVNGMGNQFYAAAAQAGSQSWKALLFGSLDRANFITVDKPPVSQWVMGLSGQIFGFSSASMLVPQALMAVASVALLYGAVGRISGRGAGLLAGAVLALTPVAALMFRFNNPDAVMVLLMTAAAYCTVRSLERASGRWIALAGVALGFAFLAKMLEGLLVMPALALAFLVAAPTSLRGRLVRLLGALAALLVSSGWFVLLTLLWPAGSRPYLAGSTDDNFMNLVLGYNGFGRVLGHNHPGGGGQGPGPGGGQGPGPQSAQSAHDGAAGFAGHGGGFGGFGGQQQGLGRLFTGEFGFEIGWLIPAALLAMVLVIVARWREPRTDLVRAGALVFGGWLLVDGLVLSYMSGTIHPYYCLSLAPAVAGLFAIGVREMWTRRTTWFGRSGLAGIIVVAGAWSFWTLGRNADWMPALRWLVLVVSLLAALTVLALGGRGRRIGTAAVAVGLIAALAGSTAYTVATLGQAHTGGGPTVGPATAQRAGGPGGTFGASTPDPQLDSMLADTDTTWSAAIDRSSAAAGLELSTGTAVMAIGGFTGSDPTPSLDEFVDYVATHQVAYYLVQNRGEDGGRQSGQQSQQGSGGPGGRESAHQDIADWVAAHFTPITVGSMTVYDLSGYRG